MPRKRRPGRPNTADQDPEAIRRDILVAARKEFVEHGLDGARVDRIAARAGVNKRLLYHYVGNKETLYSHVLLQAYRDIRAGEEELCLASLPPVEAMSRLVAFTFDHFHENPWFIRLLSTENIQRARYVREIPELQSLHSPIIGEIARILKEGLEQRVFHRDVDPVQLYITMAGMSYFYFSNIHTLAVVFGKPLATDEAMAERRAHAVEVMIAYLRAERDLPENNH